MVFVQDEIHVVHHRWALLVWQDENKCINELLSFERLDYFKETELIEWEWKGLGSVNILIGSMNI